MVAIFKSIAKLKEKQILHSPFIKGTVGQRCVLFLPPFVRVSTHEYFMAAVESLLGIVPLPCSMHDFPCLLHCYKSFIIPDKPHLK